MARRYAAATGLALLLLAASGCRSSKLPSLHPVHGTVTRGGQPLKDAQVILEPDNRTATESEYTVTGTTDDNGNVELKTIEAKTNLVKKGAPEGSYTIKVVIPYTSGDQQKGGGEYKYPKAFVVKPEDNRLPTIDVEPPTK
jgi:hypothetical protein